MPAALLGKKIGMTRLYTDDGVNVPVTVIHVGSCFVSQVKSLETDGYEAVQLAFDNVKPRNSTMPLIGHDAKAGVSPKRTHREIRLDAGGSATYELGQELTADALTDIKFVDVIGQSKGKGFQGAMKRHGFAGQEASHGVERKHRSPGSVCGRASNRGTGKPKKGIRMAGHMGDERVTVRSLPIIKIDSEQGLIMVKGPVPGAKGSLLMIQESKRLYKRKANK